MNEIDLRLHIVQLLLEQKSGLPAYEIIEYAQQLEQYIVFGSTSNREKPCS